MKIVADRNIPEVAEAFADLGEVELLAGREINPEHLRECRCLVVRSVTRVDAALLAGSVVEFVATATIGTDHVDLDYLARAGIGFANAAGCNAEAAAEYVVAGLFALSSTRDFDPFARRAGIVGCGNVGSRVAAKLESLDIEVLCCDPPLAEGGDRNREYVDLDTLLRDCDLISLHVPLARDGAYPTHHLLDAQRIDALVKGCVLINAARGEVVDNAALLETLRRRNDLAVFLDTWEGEPVISRELLASVDLATPHIAGYSVEGRLRGTQMALDAACARFGLHSGWQLAQCLPPPRQLRPRAAASRRSAWHDLLRDHWDIGLDHAALRVGIDMSDEARGELFDSLRRVYPDRLEYSRCRVMPRPPWLDATQLERMGFAVLA